jgi:GH15 family glucan-1,4-alpha-glucosidase
VALPIEGYGVIGDTHTAALVGRDGSIDWLCVPRFDSAACFAALLGDERNGRWKLAPVAPVLGTRRRYCGDSLVLETELDTEEGTVRLTDWMPVPGERGEHSEHSEHPEVRRLVEGVRGQVRMRMELVIRFDYGSVVPWVQDLDGVIVAMGGPDALFFWSPVRTHGERLTTVAEFDVAEGERFPFVLAWRPSHLEPPSSPADPITFEDTRRWWEDWAGRCTYTGPWRDAVMRSLLTLKALTYAPTGGIVAAVTTSLPEELGGVRNWDYRFCWLRDATLTLYSLVATGYGQEALSWWYWLMRAAAGDPAQVQIMYGPAGERRLTELEIPWLPGYEGSAPVRVGNAASDQYQLDVYGEIADSLYLAMEAGFDDEGPGWAEAMEVLEFLEHAWHEPDEGIWEIRGPRQHFTHSKVMAWVAMDRAVKVVERFGLDGPVDRWRMVRDEIRAEVLAKGWNADRRAFTQFYGSDRLDASVLLMPAVGFLPATDERMRATVDTIQRELCRDGLVLRYQTAGSGNVDGLPGEEGVFLACSFWLADDLALMGRTTEARALFERLLGLANDVGLLAEEYDPAAGRLLGNFPQAFSHVAVVNTARVLSACEAETSGDRLRAPDAP